MSPADYQRRLTTPWPELPETRVEGGKCETTVVNAQPPQTIEQQAQAKYAALERLFDDAARNSGRRPVFVPRES
jgi:hypothetical protein